jgi:Ca2+-binding EF-hand superfamily protein
LIYSISFIFFPFQNKIYHANKPEWKINKKKFNIKKGMDDEQIDMLKSAFSLFDTNKKGKIEREKVCLILNTLGYKYDDSELDVLLSAEDTEGEKFNSIPSLPYFSHINE